jgi:hypothetical protein
MKNWLLGVLLLITGVVHANPLLDRFLEAKEGDYLVMQLAGQRSLLRVARGSREGLLIEEVVATEGQEWAQWLRDGAPGHTSWTVYALDGAGQLEKAYSVSRETWLAIAPEEQLLARLFQLELKRVPEKERKRVGRSERLWVPPLKPDGKMLRAEQVSVWRTIWPKDGTELSGQALEIYLLEESESMPRCFPLWIEVSNQSTAAVKLRAIAGGRGLPSPAQVGGITKVPS